MPVRRFAVPTLPVALRIAGAAALALTVAACGPGINVRKELGLVGAGPDEFTVVKRKPLIMPADTAPTSADQLPAPRPGAPSPVDPRPSEEAQRALTGSVVASPTAISTAEQGLLSKAGVEDADDAIREKLTQDNENVLTGTAVDKAVQNVVQRITGSKPLEQDALDPSEEAKRLAERAKAEKNPDLELPNADKD